MRTTFIGTELAFSKDFIYFDFTNMKGFSSLDQDIFTSLSFFSSASLT
jgi:hypothetical protein